MKKLSIGIQSFEEMRKKERNYIYVDKTEILVNLIQKGSKYNFFSRPRRFGKSLAIDTIQCLFEGKKDLFKGLYAEKNWDFSKDFPVIKISFGTGVLSIKELENKFEAILNLNCEFHNITLKEKNISDKFSELILKIQQKYNKNVVILIDEYDKPILDFITKKEEAIQIREMLKNFYGVIKDSDKYLEYVFITGVSKFSKVSLFSGLNNLEDISLNDKVGELTGFTLEEIQIYFKDYLEGVDQKKMQLWYNGFNFLGKNKVFNPFDVLLFLKNKEYKNYWFETATPSFLMKLLKESKKFHYIPELENTKTNEKLIGSFDIEKIEIETLLFQTGYLTIKKVDELFGQISYTLGIPNFEIKSSLNNYILTDYLEVMTKARFIPRAEPIYRALLSGDVDGTIKYLKALFSGISYTNRLEKLAKYEGYYSSIIYTLMYTMGLDIVQEDITNSGRIDLTIKLENIIYIIEFKVEKGGKNALEQIKNKGYSEKYLGEKNKKIILLGIDFDFEKRNIGSFEFEEIKNS